MILNSPTKKEESVGQWKRKMHHSTTDFIYLACWYQRLKERYFPDRLLKQEANKLYEEWLRNIAITEEDRLMFDDNWIKY